MRAPVHFHFALYSVVRLACRLVLPCLLPILVLLHRPQSSNLIGPFPGPLSITLHQIYPILIYRPIVFRRLVHPTNLCCRIRTLIPGIRIVALLRIFQLPDLKTLMHLLRSNLFTVFKLGGLT